MAYGCIVLRATRNHDSLGLGLCDVVCLLNLLRVFLMIGYLVLHIAHCGCDEQNIDKHTGHTQPVCTLSRKGGE